MPYGWFRTLFLQCRTAFLYIAFTSTRIPSCDPPKDFGSNCGFSMRALLGFEPDLWDYIALGTILALVVAGLTVAVFVLGLPGRIAIARKHPEAEAVNLMGWAGFVAIVPWIKALGWAFKPTDVIDIRYFPQQEQRDIDEQIARLKGKSLAKPSSEPEKPDSTESEPKG
jgi:hypothetical protein